MSCVPRISQVEGQVPLTFILFVPRVSPLSTNVGTVRRFPGVLVIITQLLGNSAAL